MVVNNLGMMLVITDICLLLLELIYEILIVIIDVDIHNSILVCL